MSEAHSRRTPRIVVRRDQPLIGIPDRKGGRDIVRYFTGEEEADTASSQARIKRALALAGAWSDLDWEETLAALDRIRHESTSTPLIEL